MNQPKKQQEKALSEGSAPGAEDSNVRASKRGKRAVAETQGAGGEEDEGAAAAPAATTPAPPPAPIIAREQPHERQQRLDRTLFVLTLLLERQRQAVREKRLEQRQELLRLAETAEDPRDNEWVWDGEDDDDGEAGAVAGGGWRTQAPAEPGEQQGRSGSGRGSGSGSGDEEEGPIRSFRRTLTFASRVCRSWRDVALRAADRASLRPTSLPSLAAYDAGVLKALNVKGAPPEAGSRDERAFSRALGAALGDPSFVSVLRGLRILRLEHAAELLAALAALPRGGIVGVAARLPLPPLSPSLVTLEVERWPSLQKDLARPPLLSRANFPALRVLSVALLPESDGPLADLGGGGGGDGGGGSGGGNTDDQRAAAFAPPFLTRLRVGSLIKTPPSGNSWPDEPLLVSLASLRALGPTLRSLSVGQPWMGVQEGLAADNMRPPPNEAPMARLLPGMSTLSLLTSLALETETDLYPAGVHGLDWSDDDSFYNVPANPEMRAAKIARQREWRLAARQLFQPMRATLRRLTLESRVDLAEPVALPPALSTLSALTALVVCAFRLDSTGPLRKMVGLRVLHLAIWRSQTDWAYGLRPPPLRARDIRPLTRLENLVLTIAPSPVAPLIERGLPALTSLTLCGDETDWDPPDEWDDDEDEWMPPRPEPPLPLRVLRAARRRKQATGLNVLLEGTAGARELGDEELDEIIRKRGGGGGDGEDSDDDQEEEEEDQATDMEEDEEDEGQSGQPGQPRQQAN
jgi:hypothetical protein